MSELLEGTDVPLGGPRGMTVTRTLPNRTRRMVGAWCFLDAYGPDELTMRVGPHPHIGLQTVSWLAAGEIRHRDSLGSDQLIRPGELNLMTAGRGISHSEESTEAAGTLHGVQLWVALPGTHRDVPPAFSHHADLPVVTRDGITATVLIGELAGAESPAQRYTPLVGAEITVRGAAGLPVRPDFEYAVLTLDGTAVVDGITVPPGPLLHLGEGRSALRFDGDARVMLIGGEPFDERLVMWWNFVAREHDEVVQARQEWATGGGGFGEVRGYDGPSIPAPPMPISRLVPRGRVRT